MLTTRNESPWPRSVQVLSRRMKSRPPIRCVGLMPARARRISSNSDAFTVPLTTTASSRIAPAIDFSCAARPTEAAPARYTPLPSPHSPVSPQYDHPIAGEQVGQAARLHIIEFDTGACIDGDIGQHRACHFRCQGADCPFDVLAGPDVLRGTAGALRESIEQIRVHVVADAERKDAEPAASLLGTLHDALGVRFTRACLAIGQK